MIAVVVEDSPAVAEYIARALRSIDVEVLEPVATEDDAIALLERPVVISFAVVDLQLAQGTGFGFIRKFRERQRTLQGPPACIAVFTNHAVPALKIAAFEAGADYFFDKAKGLEQLTRIAHELATGLVGADGWPV